MVWPSKERKDRYVAISANGWYLSVYFCKEPERAIDVRLCNHWGGTREAIACNLKQMWKEFLEDQNLALFC